MRKLLLILLLSPVIAIAQKSCCTKNTQSFVHLSHDKDFAMAHLNPLPLEYSPKSGSMITFKTDGKDANAFEIKSSKATNQWLFVFHEWWGLNDYIKREAENLADKFPGVNVIAIDLYDGAIAETRERAQEMLQAMDEKRSQSIIKGALMRAGNDAKISTIGWCMGGKWALQAAILAADKGVACVMYYGMPETDAQKLKPLKAEVLGLFAKKDKWITPEVAENFSVLMNNENKKVTIKLYDADHAFANPSNPDYNKEETEKANAAAMEFLNQKLKP
jgi:carboxymethylenebutenolidase